MTEEGYLLVEPHSDLLPETFTCHVFNPDTWEDVPAHVYDVALGASKFVSLHPKIDNLEEKTSPNNW